MRRSVVVSANEKTVASKGEQLGDLFIVGLAFFIGCAAVWWLVKVLWGLVTGG